MDAVVVDVEVHDQEAARRGSEGQVLPMVKGAPGFVAGSLGPSRRHPRNLRRRVRDQERPGSRLPLVR